MGVTMNDAMMMCPAFGKGVCPYKSLITKDKGVAGKCPAFRDGCPFKNFKSVGEFVEKLAQMRDTCTGKDAHKKFFKDVLDVSDEEQKKLGACPFNAFVCPFSHDAHGKAIIPK